MADARAWHVDVTEMEKKRIFSASMLSLGTALAIASTAPVSDRTKKLLSACSFGLGLVSIISAFVEAPPPPPPPERAVEVTDFSIVKG